MIGNGYAPDYLEKVSIILDTAMNSISGAPTTIHKKAALNNRIAVLMEVADMVDQGRFYDRMQPVLHGIYNQADNDPIQSRDDASDRGGSLATQLVEDPDSVRVEVYQSTLLAVVNQVLIDRHFTPQNWQVYQQMVDGLLELGRTYAALNPTEVSSTGTPDFLDSLWRSQKTIDPRTPKPIEDIQKELNLGISGLHELMTGFEDVGQALQALKFVNNLLQAATNVVSLDAEAIQDADFLRELVAFGFEYAKLNPTNLASATNNGLDAFLATLWQGVPASGLAIRQATGKLSDLFEKLDTLQKQVDSLNFQTRLIKAINLLPPVFQQEKLDPRFVSEMVELAGIHTTLKSTQGLPLNNESSNLFLNTLWGAQDVTGLQKGTQELSELLEASTSLDSFETSLETKTVNRILAVVNQYSIDERHAILSNLELRHRINSLAPISAISVNAALLVGSQN